MYKVKLVSKTLQEHSFLVKKMSEYGYIIGGGRTITAHECYFKVTKENFEKIMLDKELCNNVFLQ